MPEPTQSETQLGLADLKKRFSAAGLQIIKQERTPGHQRSTYLAVGTAERQTDITICDNFLNDLPKTRDYHVKVESYATAVAGRIKCGSPEVFYCRSGIAIRVSILWPIQAGMMNSVVSNFILMDVFNQRDGQIAKCSMEIGFSYNRTIFDILPQTIESVRLSVDEGLVKFFKPEVRQEVYQRIEYRQEPLEACSPAEIDRFLVGKAYMLGFLAVDEPSDVWAADPWDAEYLGVTKKELLLQMRVLRANGMFEPGQGAEYVRPSDKLLAQQSAGNQRADEIFAPQLQMSLRTLPNKEALLSDLKIAIDRKSTYAVLVIDLDHFKEVNDQKGHSAGDA